MPIGRDAIETKWYWATLGAPDAISAGHASRVQRQIASGGRDDPVEYIMNVYGDTREQAEAIVKNCRTFEE